MGFVHIAATFTPLIAGKLALLPVGVSDAFTHFVRSLWGMLIGLIPTLAASGVYVLIFK